MFEEFDSLIKKLDKVISKTGSLTESIELTLKKLEKYHEEDLTNYVNCDNIDISKK